MATYQTIESCRVSRRRHLVGVLNLGEQDLTGVFPASPSVAVTRGPIELVWCPDSGLLQLRHSYAKDELYGENYGYRSGLNQSMVDHLTAKVGWLTRLVRPSAGEVVLDIGSNDATTLKAYTTPGLQRVGIDPTGSKFAAFYESGIELIPDFFSARGVRSVLKERSAKIVTSIAMFYDLDDPVQFAREVESILAVDGVWHFEQSYMPSMLRMNSYDTICHEHLEYYSLSVVCRILEAAGMRPVDVVMNAVNGGSFAVTACRKDSPLRSNRAVIDWFLEQEQLMGLDTPKPYRDFEERVFRHRKDLTRLVRTLVADGKTILGYGASTKGNVVLQFCGLTPDDIPAIAEVNPDKFGRVTPGTHIPIISEKEARQIRPDYFLVLPWHFKDGILRREAQYLADGGKMIFPFPEIEIV